MDISMLRPGSLDFGEVSALVKNYKTAASSGSGWTFFSFE